MPTGKDQTIVVQREAIKAPELIFLQGRKQAGHPSWFLPKLTLKSVTVSVRSCLFSSFSEADNSPEASRWGGQEG